MRFTLSLLISTICLGLLSFSSLAQKNAMVSGVVQTSSGEPVTGANVLLSNSKYHYQSISDENGKFLLKNIIQGEYVLDILYTGMTEYKRSITVNGTSSSIIAKLQQTITQLNEVTVTTQKRQQNYIEVPITISVLGSSKINQLNLHNMDEMSLYTPGLQVQNQSPNNSSFVIRGVTSDDGDSRVQQRVSVFQDGMSISKAKGASVELFDLERIEVAKGPQGTLFGRSAENGAIHLIENKPVNNTSGALAIGYGNYNEKILNGFYNTPVIKNKLLNRFAFTYNDRDGFIKNISGGTLNGKNALAFRDIVRFVPNDRILIDWIANYEHNSTPGTSFKSGTYAPAGGSTDPYTDADLGNGRKDSLYIHRDVWSISVPVTYKINNYTSFTSLTAFRHFNSDEAFNSDGTIARTLYFHEKEKDDQFSQEFRLNFSGKNKFSGFLGASYFYENGNQVVPLQTNPQTFYTLLTPVIVANYGTMLNQLSGAIQQLGQLGYLSAAQTQYFLSQVPTAKPLVINGVANPTTNLPNLKPLLPYIGSSLPSSAQQLLGLFDGSALPTSYKQDYANYNTTGAFELFADGTYKVTKQLSVTAGLRGTYEHQIGGYSSQEYTGSTVLGYLTGYYPNLIYYYTGGKKVTASKDYFSYVGRISANYLFGKNNVYASISRGRRPGVIDIGDTKPVDSAIYLQPEIIWSYEAGIKGIVSNKFSYDFAMYYYGWRHFQSSVFNPTTLKFEPKDAGKAHSFGFETGLQYNFMKLSNIFANYGFIDGEFNKKGEDGQAQKYADNTFRLTPKHSFSIGLNLVIPVNKIKSTDFYFRPSYAYKSKVYFEDDNTEALSQDGYGIANLAFGLTFGKSVKYDIGFYSKNLFDKKYLIDAGNAGETFGIPTYIAGARLTYGFILKMNFLK